MNASHASLLTMSPITTAPKASSSEFTLPHTAAWAWLVTSNYWATLQSWKELFDRFQNKLLTPVGVIPPFETRNAAEPGYRRVGLATHRHQVRWKIREWSYRSRAGCWTQKSSLSQPKIASLFQEDSDKGSNGNSISRGGKNH